MSDLKQIAARMRSFASSDTYRYHEAMGRFAAALDALAAQEPVAVPYDDIVTQHGRSFVKMCDERGWLFPNPALGYLLGNMRAACEHAASFRTAPQPAPPQPFAPEEFEKALMNFARQHARAITPPIHPDWTTTEEYDEAKAEVLRLYALASAAPQRMTVSQSDVFNACMKEAVATHRALKVMSALGIEVTP